MKILIIPDIHQKIALLENILNKAEKDVDLTIFLGDYFDDFEDNAYEVEAMAIWLKKNLYKDKRIFLMGNHDFHYRVPPYTLYCSGYGGWKHEIINTIISEVDWKQLKFFHNVDNYWFSHAGITDHWFSHPVHGLSVFSIQNNLKQVEAALKNRIYAGLGAVWAADRYRGGMHKKGGCLWNDMRNSEYIPGITQVIGHTPLSIPVIDKNEEQDAINIFCDTHLQYYLILDTETKNVEIMENILA